MRTLSKQLIHRPQIVSIKAPVSSRTADVPVFSTGPAAGGSDGTPQDLVLFGLAFGAINPRLQKSFRPSKFLFHTYLQDVSSELLCWVGNHSYSINSKVPTWVPPAQCPCLKVTASAGHSWGPVSERRGHFAGAGTSTPRGTKGSASGQDRCEGRQQPQLFL